MQTVRSNPHLMMFKDQRAPYRGTWIIYSSQTSRGFTACHEVEDESRASKLIEKLILETIQDVKDFGAHLNLHGWSTSYTSLW
jgi:hypothetical protein